MDLPRVEESDPVGPRIDARELVCKDDHVEAGHLHTRLRVPGRRIVVEAFEQLDTACQAVLWFPGQCDAPAKGKGAPFELWELQQGLIHGQVHSHLQMQLVGVKSAALTLAT